MLDQIKLLEKIEAVCRHPKTYTSKGAFGEIAEFLEKYGDQVIVGEYYYHSVFTPFLKWFTEKNKISEKEISLKKFREYFSSDEEALKNLHFEYEKYVKSLQI